ncbi:MAG: helix-turn-helix domain-containing protein [Rubrivivax sp.]|nr:helix-turn-helix domain-containing protein [Rubrivivax sp.]
MSKKRPLLALVAYDGLRTFEYSIAADLFAAERSYLGVDWYDTIVVTPDRGRLRGVGGVEVRASAPFESIARAATIVIPGWRDVTETPPARLLDALRAAARRRARLLSLCSGAFVLGSAGLLDGRRATTHWLFADEFKRRFPLARYERDVLYVDEGPVITSAGSAAGLDACLHLVRRDFGARVANTVARRMVVAPHREGGQAQYVEAPVAPRANRGIGPAMDWARVRLDQPVSVAELAARSAMSERTFLRRFSAAAGMPPLAWLQQQRMARARQLMEAQPAMGTGDIATQCGYESMETFRAAFRRVVGVAPATYRARFAARPA